MKNLQKREQFYPVDSGDNLIQDAISRHLGNIEPRRENNFLSNIFSKRVTNNFIRIKVYNNCTFYLGNGEEED
jgi:hypothetical protein